MSNKTSEAQLKAARKYKKEHCERVEFTFRREENWKERIDAHCKEFGYISDGNKGGINRAILIKKALETQMAIDRGEMKLTKPKEKESNPIKVNEAKTIKELKEIILDNGMTIEQTGFKGRYKVTSKDGLLWETVRFSNAKSCSYATVNVLYYDFEGRESWTPMYIEGFIKKMTL